MMKHRLPSTLFVCFVIFFPLLPGCLGVQPSLPEKHTFVLDVSRQSESVPPQSEAVLRIRTFGISPQYEGRGFVYRTGDLSYQSDFYNEFLTSPGSLIAEQVRQWLADSGIFGQVVDFSGQVAPTHILKGKVIDLYGDYSRGTQPRAALEIEF